METIRFRNVDFSTYITKRQGETKLGESIRSADDPTAWVSAEFVLLGIDEDTGIRRNGGVGHRLGTYPEFLKSFLNIQENAFLSGELFVVDGYFTIEEETDDCLEKLDRAVSDKILNILSGGQTPIVIGGGHNNAYGLLRGAALYQQQAVNVINLDAHADLRSTGMRHSGNGFSQAIEDGFLKRYAMLGLHEAYNNEYILERIRSDNNLKAVFFEDIVIRQRLDYESALADSLQHVSAEGCFGVEWDVDSLENMLSSAMTPVGWSTHQVLRFLYESGRQDGLYLHISESVRERADGLKNPMLGKLLAYAVQAFVKGKTETF